MKKILSALLAAVMICSAAFALTGCKLGFFDFESAAPSEKFENAYKGVGDEMRVGVLNEKFKIEGLNRCDLTVEIEMPALLQNDKVVLDVKGGFDKEAEDLSADIIAKYKTSELPVKAEIDGGEKVYLSFPGVVNDYLYYELSGDEDFGKYGEILSAVQGVMGKADEVKDRLDDLIDKYTDDDRVKVETADAEVLGKTVSGAEKLSVTLGRDDIVNILDELTDICKDLGLDEYCPDFDEDEIEDDAAMDAVMYVKDGKTVRADFVITGAEYESIAVYEMAASSGNVETKLNVTVKEDGEVVAEIPFSYEHTVSGDKVEGKASVDLSSISDEDSDIPVGALNVEFSGRESGDTSEMDYVFKIGGGGMTVELPVHVKLTKTSAESLEVECVIDAEAFGVKLSANGRLSKEAVALSTYDPANAIDLTDTENEENGDRIEALLGALTPRVSDFVSLITGLLGSYGSVIDY